MGTLWDFLVFLYNFLLKEPSVQCLISCRIWQLTRLSPVFHANQTQSGFLNKLVTRWQHEKEMCIVYFNFSFFYNRNFEDQYKTEFSNDISLHLGVCLIICYYVYSALMWCNTNKWVNQTKGFWGTYSYTV